METYRLIQIAALLAATVVSGTVLAQGKDELWEETQKIDMPGMPVTPPPRVARSCYAAGHHDRMTPEGDGECRISNFRRSGNKATWQADCKDGGKQDFELTYSATQSTMTIRMQNGGRVLISGRRVGNCDANTYAEVKSEKELSQIERMTCDHAVNSLDPEPLVPRPGSVDSHGYRCGAYKDKFCAKAKSVSNEMQDPKSYERAYDNYPRLDAAFRLCGQNTQKLQASICQNAGQQSNYEFVGKHCRHDRKLFATACQQALQKKDYAFVGEKCREDGSAIASACQKAVQDGQFAFITEHCRGDKKVLAAACKKSVEMREYGFVSENCPEEKKVVIANECGKRDYSHLWQICPDTLDDKKTSERDAARSTADGDRKPDARTTGQSTGGEAQQPKSAGKPKDAVEEGTKALRKFLKF